MWAALKKTFGDEVPDHLQACVRRLTTAKAAAERSEQRSSSQVPSESDHGGSHPGSPRSPSPGFPFPSRMVADPPVFTAGERARATTVSKVFSPRTACCGDSGGSAPATASRASPQRPRKQGSPDRSPPVFQRLLRDAKDRRSRTTTDEMPGLLLRASEHLPSHKLWAPGMAQPQVQARSRTSSREGRGSSPMTARAKSSSGKASRGSSPSSSRVKAYLQGVSLGLTSQPSAPGYPQVHAILENVAMTSSVPSVASPSAAPGPAVAQASTSNAAHSPELSSATTSPPAAHPASHGAMASALGSPKFGSSGAPGHAGQQRAAAAKSANRRQPQAHPNHERLFKEATTIHERRQKLSESWQEAEQEKIRKEAKQALHNPLGRTIPPGSTSRRQASSQLSGLRRRSPSPADSCKDEAPGTRSPRESTRSPLRTRSPNKQLALGAPTRGSVLSTQVVRKTSEHRGKAAVISTATISSSGERGKSVEEEQSSMPTALPPTSSANASVSAPVAVSESEVPAPSTLADQDLVMRDITVMKRQLGLLMVGVDVLKRKVADVEASGALPATSASSLQTTSTKPVSKEDLVPDPASVQEISTGTEPEPPCNGEKQEARPCDELERTTGDEGDASATGTTSEPPSSYPISRMTSAGGVCPPSGKAAKLEEGEAFQAPPQGDVMLAAGAAADGHNAALKLAGIVNEAIKSSSSLSTQSEVVRKSSASSSMKEFVACAVGMSVACSTDVAQKPGSSEVSPGTEAFRYPPDRMQQLPLPLPGQLGKGSSAASAAPALSEPAEPVCTPQRQWVWTGPGGNPDTASPGPIVHAGPVAQESAAPRAVARGRRREDPVEMCPKRNLADELSLGGTEAAVPSREVSAAISMASGPDQGLIVATVELTPPEAAPSGGTALQPAQFLPPRAHPAAPRTLLPQVTRLPEAEHNSAYLAVAALNVVAHAQQNPISRYTVPASVQTKVEAPASLEATWCPQPIVAVAEPPLITGDIIYNGRSTNGGSGRYTSAGQAVNGVVAAEYKPTLFYADTAQNLPFMEQVSARLVELKKAETESPLSGPSTPSKSQAELPQHTHGNGL